jgi:hypothetical protein
MPGFTLTLQLVDGTPADPPKLTSAVPNWRRDDVVPLGGGRSLRVLARCEGDEPDDDPILVVEAA